MNAIRVFASKKSENISCLLHGPETGRLPSGNSLRRAFQAAGGPALGTGDRGTGGSAKPPSLPPARSIFLALFLLILPFFPLFAAGEDGAVYVTPSGARYHLENCSTLRNSARVNAVSLAEALRLGRSPCAVCNPPAAGAPASAAPAPAAPGALYRLNLPGQNGAYLASSAAADRSRMIPAAVVRHVDGDTVYVRFTSPPAGIEENETVRMIGVDTPETVHPVRGVERFGREASDYTKSRLLGKSVLVAFDRELRDRYGRLLCYLYTDSGCFNAELVREGYAHAYTRFPFQFMEEFRTLERGARESRRGLWGD